MTIAFNQIPGNLRVPFMYWEINPGQSPYQSNSRCLLIGQKLPSGSAAANTPVQVTGGEDSLFGYGSQLAAMYKAARKAAPFREIWAGALDDADGAVAATGKLTIEGCPLSSSGTIVLYIGDIRVTTTVSMAMTNASTAAALAAAINACDSMQVSAHVSRVGAKASGSATVTGPATAAGSASLTVNGVTYSTAVAVGDTAATIADNLNAAIGLTSGANIVSTVAGATLTIVSTDSGIDPNLYAATGASSAAGVTVTAVAMTGGTQDEITLTANNAGSLGNTIGVYTKLYTDDGTLADEMVSITPMSGGTGDPAITSLLAALGDEEFDWVAMPYDSAAYLSEMDTFMDARWGPMQQLYGHYVTVKSATAGALMAFTSQRNGWHGTLLGTYKYPAPTYLLAASLAAIMCDHLQDAPELSRPLQTLTLPGFRGPKDTADRWSIVNRQSFYFYGVSALTVARDGSLVIDRVLSMYQRDKWGSPDQTWLDVNTQAQVMYGVRYLKQKITSTYPRCALADSNPYNLQGVVTADDIRNTIVHGYRELVADGVFENADMFEQLLVVERNAENPNRVDMYLPLDHVNQLRIVAGNATSYLQYPAAA